MLIGPVTGPGTSYTSVGEALGKIVTPAGTHIEVLQNGEPVAAADPLATGMELKLLSSDGQILSTAVAVVKGDVTGSGRMNISQLTAIAAALVHTKPLTGPYLQAADWNGNGDADLADLVQEARSLTGQA